MHDLTPQGSCQSSSQPYFLVFTQVAGRIGMPTLGRDGRDPDLAEAIMLDEAAVLRSTPAIPATPADQAWPRAAPLTAARTPSRPGRSGPSSRESA